MIDVSGYPPIPILLIFDWETTGLTYHERAPLEMQPRAIEFGGLYMSLNDGSIISNFQFLINPECPIPPAITKITGIRDEDVRDKPTFAQVFPTLIAPIFKDADSIVAHNLPFDKDILKYERMRTHTGQDVVLPAKQFCTLELYRQIWGKDMKLADLHETVTGRAPEKAHRGLADVVSLANIIQHDKLYELMR